MDCGVPLLGEGRTVSEYQYYEFRAVDRPLDERDRRTLRSLSTRAEITPTSFVNTYNWGDFKGDPDALMEKCFDAFVYVANWGTRRFVLRLLRKLLTRRLLSAYCRGESLRGRNAGEFVVIEFCRQEEGGEWEEGEGWMASLIPLRADLLRGDHRCLYLGWLCCAQNEELDEDEIEPPVPPGMKALSGSLEAFVEFMGIDSDLLDVAASVSAQPMAPPTRDELASWIRALPVRDKDALLVAAALNAGPQTGAEILWRYDLSRKNGPPIEAQPSRRTVGELLAAAKKLAAKKARLAAELQAAERARQEQEAAKARARYLDQLAGREQATWQKVEVLIQTKQPNKYDIAVSLLIDLRDLAARNKREVDFQVALGKLRDSHAAKPSLLRRLLDAGL
jgi:hypothetical protein